MALTISGVTTIQTIQFTTAAPAYSFDLTNDLRINGSGIISDSLNVRPLFTTNGSFIQFINGSSAGNADIATSTGGIANFENTSTASTSSIVKQWSHGIL